MGQVVYVPEDGDCFFHAVAHEFHRQGLNVLLSHELRARAINYLINHPEIWAIFPPERGTKVDYLYFMSKSGTFAEGIIIDALALEFNVHLDIVDLRINETGDVTYNHIHFNQDSSNRETISLVRYNEHYYSLESDMVIQEQERINIVSPMSIFSTSSSSSNSPMDGSRKYFSPVVTRSELRQVFCDGSNVPHDAILYKEGKFSYMQVDDGPGVIVSSYRVWRDSRLKFTNGNLVPEDALIRRAGGKVYVISSGGMAEEVFTSRDLSKRRLKDKHGNLLPKNAVIREQGEKTFASIDGGEEEEVFRSSIWTNRRLKYFNGTLVPESVHTFKNGTSHYANVDGGEAVKVYTSGALSSLKSHFRSKKPVVTPMVDGQLPHTDALPNVSVDDLYRHLSEDGYPSEDGSQSENDYLHLNLM
jgi:hypothetical protein